MVQLPKEHITLKLESLKPDLRAKADAIIAKKFNIKDKAKESWANISEKMITTFTDVGPNRFYANGQDPIQRSDSLQMDGPRRIEGRIANINPDGPNTIHLDARCQCGGEFCNNIPRSSPDWNWRCPRCGNTAFVKIPGMYRESMQGMKFPSNTGMINAADFNVPPSMSMVNPSSLGAMKSPVTFMDNSTAGWKIPPGFKY